MAKKSMYPDDMAAALGITSGQEISRRYNSPIIYFSLRDEPGRSRGDHNSFVEWPHTSGDWLRSERIFLTPRPQEQAASRDAHLNAAIEWASRYGLDVDDWAPTKLDDTWVPASVMQDVRSQLNAYRYKQRCLAQAGAR